MKTRREQFEDWWRKKVEYCAVDGAAYLVGEAFAWESWQAARQVTPQMIEEGAQALLSWDEGCVWPDSWGVDAHRHRKDAEKCFKAMIGEYL